MHDELERAAAADSSHNAIICRRITLLQQRSQTTPEQVYDAMTAAEELATSRASFLAIWQAVGQLSEGDLESLADLVCAAS